MRNKSKERLFVIILSMVSIMFFYVMSKYLNMGIPYYLHPDEPITSQKVINMFNNNTFALDYFRYPGFNFYYGLIVLKLFKSLFKDIDFYYLMRLIYVGTALLSNIFIYFSLKKICKDKFISFIGFILSLTSLYVPQWLYYTGPDVLLYAIGNLILYLFISLIASDNDEKNIYFYYPLFAIFIGIAIAVKYHGVMFYILLLYIHMKKKYYKNYKFNFVLLISSVLIPLVFVLSNFYMFADFKLFIEDFLFNLNHYTSGHQGYDDPMPLLTYFNIFFSYEFGYMGAVLLLLGFYYFIKNKNCSMIIALMLLPVATILMLNRFNMSIQRNISFCIPFAYIFMTMGLLEAKTLFGKIVKRKQELNNVMIAVLVVIMALSNLIILSYITTLDDSRTIASQYILENIPEGSTIYTPKGTNKNGTYYMPGIDPEKYIMTSDRGDLNKGDYIVNTTATYIRLYQKNHLLLGGEYLYSSQLEGFQKQLEDYELINVIPGFYEIYEQNFMDRGPYDFRIFGRSNKKYYFGPTIDVYKSKEDLRYDYSTVLLKGNNIRILNNSNLQITVNIDNQSKAKLTQKAGNGIHPVKIYYQILDEYGNVVLDNGDALIPLKEDIDRSESKSIELNIEIKKLNSNQTYFLEIDIVKENMYRLSELGMETLSIPIDFNN